MVGKQQIERGACALVLLFAFVFPVVPASAAVTVEYNRFRGVPPAIGTEAHRFIVAFRLTGDNATVQTIHNGLRHESIRAVQAQTSGEDVAVLARRVRLDMVKSQQLTPSMHVIYLRRTLYGSEVEAALGSLRADPAVKFADVDQRRYPHALPDDPLFNASASATGQWYLMTPSSATPGSDAAATDAVSAWAITTGSTGTVIADVDTGVRFDHPDLLRAGFGGRLLPGYDFVGGDLNSSGVSLGTFLIANDGDGYDPDPSDTGDWISSADQSKTQFPAKDCPIQDSSWHGTRVIGILGALTNNAAGIAGMTWNPYLLPVRALGKCGGYDSDIITGIQWAAGLAVTGVPNNPYPADIINLSLGATGACPSAYADVVRTLSAMGVLVVASAGNGSKAPDIAAVDAPANCTGVLGVAGLRNVGTKVGYSSFGSEVGVAAPAGNCVNSSGPCLRSIDTTSNTGLTVPADSTYTDSINPNLGTSFSAPIVSGIAALMRAVNANLSPPQLIARIKASAAKFPQPAGLPVCPMIDQTSGECACPNDGKQCGAGMVNALDAVTAAERPIAAVVVPAMTAVGRDALLDASGSVAACGRTIATYAWIPSGGVVIQSGAATPQATVTPQGTAGSITLTVTDTAGALDSATLTVSAGGSVTADGTTPQVAGTSAGACPSPLTVSILPPTVTENFAPASVPENVPTTLTLKLANPNAFDLTQAALTATLPAGLVVALPSGASSTGSSSTTCGGGGSSLSVTGNTVTLSGANIPASGTCSVSVSLQSATAASYSFTVPANALQTGPAGSNAVATSAALTVSVPSKGGGGALDWWDTLFVVGVLLAGRRGLRRGPAQSRFARHSRSSPAFKDR